MKPSEMIQKALTTTYIRGNEWEGEDKSEFMCHALKYASGAGDWIPAKVYHAIGTFMPIIREKGTECLCNYLSRTNKVYANYRSRYGSNSLACYKRRVAFWEEHVANLQAKGM